MPEEEDAIRSVFEDFRAVLRPVGTAKALHLLAPRFFPLWDTKIRYAYRVASVDPEREAERYWTFMAIVREQVELCGGEAVLGRNPLKALDEYNYCRFTLKAAELA